MNSAWDTGGRVSGCPEAAVEVEKVWGSKTKAHYEIAVCARHAAYLRADALNFISSNTAQATQG